MAAKASRRDDKPFIRKDDEVFIERGAGQGNWKVADVRYKNPADVTDDTVSLLLVRGPWHMRAEFNRETMRLKTTGPVHKLTRDIRAPETARFKKKL